MFAILQHEFYGWDGNIMVLFILFYFSLNEQKFYSMAKNLHSSYELFLLFYSTNLMVGMGILWKLANDRPQLILRIIQTYKSLDG